ncbi:MAG: transcription termination factor Rho [Chlamydiota bacterium]|nr:transcription termination factor Rho [Chlamydiota bacterium]
MSSEGVLLPDSGCAVTHVVDLQAMPMPALVRLAEQMEINHLSALNHSQVVFEVIRHKALIDREAVIAKGVLEIHQEGYGFLRSVAYHYLPSAEDVYLSAAQIRRFELKKGDLVEGAIRPPKERDKYFVLFRPDRVNGRDVEQARKRISFNSLTPLHPQKRLMMEIKEENLPMRLLDLCCPIGKGQRGLIVAPPKTGKTVLLQNVAHAIATNHPEVKLIVLLIDERPEEVTEMKRMVKGEVISSTFDEPPSRHTQVADMVLEKARSFVEYGEDVVILLDSITRLARAYNTVQPHSGKILTGGVDASSLHKPKRFFGSARQIENGGSLTIIATALVDTGSRMDEVIYEEFKGTGNMELVLDRRLAEKRIFPAIDIVKSSTRKEELLYDKEELEKVYMLRSMLSDLTTQDAMKLLMGRMKNTKTNIELLLSIKEMP